MSHDWPIIYATTTKQEMTLCNDGHLDSLCQPPMNLVWVVVGSIISSAAMFPYCCNLSKCNTGKLTQVVPNAACCCHTTPCAAVFDNGNMLLWSTNTAGRGVAPRRFQVQSDGNALIADATNRAIWVTYTAGM